MLERFIKWYHHQIRVWREERAQTRRQRRQPYYR